MTAVFINLQGCPEQERLHLFYVTQEDRIRIDDVQFQGRKC